MRNESGRSITLIVDSTVLSVIIMLVTKKCDGVIFLHIDDEPIGHQHSNIPECDVDDRCVIFDTKTESR